MLHLSHNQSFHGILVDLLFLDEQTKLMQPFVKKQRKYVTQLVREGIKAGVVKPLKRTVFSRDEVEDAFRFMASGKHIGKVLLKIRDENETDLRVLAIPRTVFCNHKGEN